MKQFMATKKEQQFSHHNKSKQQNKEQKSVCGTNRNKRVNKNLGQGTNSRIHEKHKFYPQNNSQL
jgi:hypothetical protein